MSKWKYTEKDVTPEEIDESLKAVKSACFGCETHSSDCSIAKAAGDVAALKDEENIPVKDQIHAQIAGALAGATFPIATPDDLIAAFPDGANTTCRVGDLKMTAGEAGTLLKPSDFPFKSATDVADVIVSRAGL
ncbi:MTH865 family protein [Methanocalculus chunghsingensis]|uniref:MTH865 family protein n=1 Tax=Methanocalculus chunghsingensis TaxID=156457 RepID=UPI001B8C8E06|nr:MTH865 family protein [Methanocalculus chunghsingensis]